MKNYPKSLLFALGLFAIIKIGPPLVIGIKFKSFIEHYAVNMEYAIDTIGLNALLREGAQDHLIKITAATFTYLIIYLLITITSKATISKISDVINGVYLSTAGWIALLSKEVIVQIGTMAVALFFGYLAIILVPDSEKNSFYYFVHDKTLHKNELADWMYNMKAEKKQQVIDRANSSAIRRIEGS